MPCPIRPIRSRPVLGGRRVGRVPNEVARAEPSAVEPSCTDALVTADTLGSTAEVGGMPQVSQ